MTLRNSENDHPFAHTTVIYFGGSANGSHVFDPSFAGFSVGDKVHIRGWLEDRDGNYFVRILEDGDPDCPAGAPAWNTDWFTDDPSKIHYPTTTVQEDAMTENTTTRPTIDFSGDSRLTARQYAQDHISRVNKPETNDVLRLVARGQEVDVYDLNEALLDAMRRVATRFGQSMARRRAGEQLAHIGYIVNGVLANVADDLPAYEKGERSRLVEEAKTALVEAREEVEAVTAAYERRGREVASLREKAEEHEERGDAYAEQVEKLLRERDLLTQAASDERRRLVAEIDGLKAQRDALAEKVKASEADRDVWASGVLYAHDLLSKSEAARLLGYIDGLQG